MNKSTDNNFQWDDNLVKDFTEYVGLRVGKNHDIREQINYLCEDFKQSKLPSQPTEQTLSSKGEREWEIVSLKAKNGAITHLKTWILAYMRNELKEDTIYSVKRLSDNVVFQVGDKVNYGHKIKSFLVITPDNHLTAVSASLAGNIGDMAVAASIPLPNINFKDLFHYKEPTNGSIHTKPNTYPITKDDDKVTREELLEAEHKAFYAAREDYDRGGCSPKMRKYPTFSDYKDSQK